MSATTPDNANSRRGRLVAMLLAFLIWGGWALFANWRNDPTHALVAGLLQGAFSAALTLLMAMTVTALFRRLPDNPLRVALPALLIVSVSFTLLFLLHSWHQTPALWQTIIPPSSMAFAYCLFLSLRLHREARALTLNNETP
ncbi:hypothetical protein [Halopseudomonas sp.]|jgi:TRAP-type C4-dicarboxylate transport system permease small subunit|uniref:hypothetical protein n=1 Tax=Halopseudomonas sp. TaxID=2901191 RepID=UPI003001188B